MTTAQKTSPSIDGPPASRTQATDAAALLTAVREHARLDQAALASRVLDEAGFDAVVVREDQPFGGDERRRAAGEPNDREPDSVEPRLADLDAVRLRDRRAREVVERPHAFVGAGLRTGETREREHYDESVSDRKHFFRSGLRSGELLCRGARAIARVVRTEGAT